MFQGSGQGDALFFPLLEFPAAATWPVSTPPLQPLASSGDILGTFRCLCCPLKVLAPAPKPSTALGAPGLLLPEAFALKVISRIKAMHAFVCLVFGVFLATGELGRKERAPCQLPPCIPEEFQSLSSTASSRQEVSHLPFAGGVVSFLVFACRKLLG